MSGTQGEVAYQQVEYDGTTDTIYDILTHLMVDLCGFGLYALDGEDDIIDVLTPKFTINAMPYEDATEVLYRLLTMTKSIIRPENDTSGGKLAWFRLITIGHSEDTGTYYSDGQEGTKHGFTEFEWRDHSIEPNYIVVFANQAEDGTWTSIITGTSDGSSGEWKQVKDYYLAPELTLQADATARALAIRTRIKMEEELGRLVIPHDCGLELFDNIVVEDKRESVSYVEYPIAGSKWVGYCIAGSLTHVYEPGRYDLEITLNSITANIPVDSGAVGQSARALLEQPVAESWIPSQYYGPGAIGEVMVEGRKAVPIAYIPQPGGGYKIVPAPQPKVPGQVYAGTTLPSGRQAVPIAYVLQPGGGYDIRPYTPYDVPSIIAPKIAKATVTTYSGYTEAQISQMALGGGSVFDPGYMERKRALMKLYGGDTVIE